jgi:hypothetical protein
MPLVFTNESPSPKLKGNKGDRVSSRVVTEMVTKRNNLPVSAVDSSLLIVRIEAYV